MDEELDTQEMDDQFMQLEQQIVKLLGLTAGSAYNSLESWALVVRATSNDGSGDRTYGGLFMPPEQDKFKTAGLKWLFDEGFRNLGT